MLVLSLILKRLSASELIHYMTINKTILETPQSFFDSLQKEFNFTTDVCALDYNAKCEHYFSPEDNGLLQEWVGSCWCNPPYDKNMGTWVRKAYESAQAGATVVCLIHPNYHDSEWWHEYVMRSSQIRFIRGRLKFTNFNYTTSLKTVLVIFYPFCKGPPATKSITRTGASYNKPLDTDTKGREIHG